MKLLILASLAAFAVGVEFRLGRKQGGNVGPAPGAETETPIPEMYFTQNLDHFRPTTLEQTWQQRYFESSQYYDPKLKTVFLMIGGEKPISNLWMTGGAWIMYALKYKPYLFQLEHRYYGSSRPTKDFSTQNLQYLTSQQALEDLATFIEAMNEQHQFPKDVKWIVFGGSYAGSLAAWLRLKYPHLVAGAVASSAPMRAVFDFTQYFSVVFDDLKNISPACLDSFVAAITQVDEIVTSMSEGSYTGGVNLNTEFNICGNLAERINSEQDVINFFNKLVESVSNVAQYNDNNDNNPVDLKVICRILTNTSLGSEMDRLSYFFRSENPGPCVNANYDALVKFVSDVQPDVTNGYRQWFYQSCTEFGFFQTSDQNPPVIPNRFPISFYKQYCRDVFGSGFTDEFYTEMIQRTNTFYGGMNISVSNVVFLQGTVDPWHTLGITKTIHKDAPAILIEGTAHVADVYNPSPKDLPGLTRARRQVMAIIGTWLK